MCKWIPIKHSEICGTDAIISDLPKDGEVYAWDYGQTSWSANDDEEAIPWSYVELAESEEK